MESERIGRKRSQQRRVRPGYSPVGDSRTWAFVLKTEGSHLSALVVSRCVTQQSVLSHLHSVRQRMGL